MATPIEVWLPMPDDIDPDRGPRADPPAGAPGPVDPGDLATVEMERDALAAEVARLRGARDSRWQATTVVLLVVLACLVFTAAVPGLWARRNVLDTDRFVSRVAPLVEEPEVQEVLTLRLTEQLMALVDPRALFEEALPARGQLLAGPLTNAVEGFVQERVARFVASEQFVSLWRSAVTAAHRTSTAVLRGDELVEGALLTDGGEVRLNLLPIIDAVLAQISGASPELLGREIDLPELSIDEVPAEVILRLEDALGVDLGDEFGQVAVYDDGTLAAAQDGVALADRLLVVLLPISVVLAALALWLSRRRRRTLVQICVGVAIGMVVIRRVAFRADAEVTVLPPTEEGRQAIGVVTDAFFEPLVSFAAWALGVAVGVAALALVTGDQAWAVSLRRRAGGLWASVVSSARVRADDEATVAWIAAHRDAVLLVAGVVGLVVLWTVDLSWFGLLLVLALGAAVWAIVARAARANAVEAPVGGPPGVT